MAEKMQISSIQVCKTSSESRLICSREIWQLENSSDTLGVAAGARVINCLLTRWVWSNFGQKQLSERAPPCVAGGKVQRSCKQALRCASVHATTLSIWPHCFSRAVFMPAVVTGAVNSPPRAANSISSARRLLVVCCVALFIYGGSRAHNDTEAHLAVITCAGCRWIICPSLDHPPPSNDSWRDLISLAAVSLLEGQSDKLITGENEILRRCKLLGGWKRFLNWMRFRLIWLNFLKWPQIKKYFVN